MVKYNPMIVTTQGQKYMLEASNTVDNTIFSKVVISDKTYAQGDLKGLTAIDNIKLTVTNPAVTAINSTTISTIASFNNKTLTSAVTANTIGLYAVSNDDNKEFLYATSTASEAFTFKAYSEADGVQNFNIHFNATLASQPEGGDTGDASSSAYVTIEMLNSSESRANTYTDRAVTDLHLGANNIIKGTEDLNNFSTTTGESTSVALNDDSTEAIVSYTGATNGSGGFNILASNFDSHSIQPKAGDIVTMSYEAKGVGKYELSQKFADSWYKVKSETVTSDFKRYELTFEWQADFTQLSFLAHPSANNSMTIRHFKLELSPKATDWLSLPKDGTSNFIHVAYADDDKGLNFSLVDTDRAYLGIYIDDESKASTAPSLYKWIKVRGEDGLSGTDGVNGSNGKTSYIHNAYANSEDGALDFSTTDATSKKYMGIYSDFKAEPSPDPGTYTWSRIRGEDGKTPIKGSDYFDGKNGQDGLSSYLWVRYASDELGASMTTDPTNAKYVGYATTTTNNAPANSGAYTWHLVVGNDGIPGEKGADGKTSYLHIKYSDDNGQTFTAHNGEDSGVYIGQYTDFTKADSSNVNDYNWSQLKGDKGDQGEIGLQGPKGDEGIQGPIGPDGLPSYTHLAYANSDNGTVDFSVSDSARDYIGMYTDSNIIDSDDSTSYNWSLIKGANGANGTPGKAGADGKTSYFHVAYAESADGTTGFSVTESLNKPYIGQYTDFTQADSTDPTKYTWTLIKGDKGDKGDQGEQGLQGEKGDKGIQGPIGADGKSSYTHIAYSNSADGKTDFSVSDSNRTYIGMYVDQNSNDSTDSTKYAWSLIRGRDGANGTPGKAGVDGKTPYLHIAYATSADGSSGFSTTDSVSKTYIGQYTDYIAEDSNAASSYTWTLFKGDKGDKGDTGADGKPGKDGLGIKETIIAYQLGSSDTDAPTGTWTETVPTLVKGMYLWTRTTLTYTDNSSEPVYSVTYIAKDGNSGKDGIAGKDGVGIKSTVVTYAVDSNGTSVPTTGWSTTPPTLTDGQYLWTRTTLTYTDGTAEPIYSVAKSGSTGPQGPKGDTGKDGLAGKDGLGIKSTTITYQLGDSGTTHPTGTWSTNVPALTKGQYLWSRTTLTYTDSTTEQLYSVTYIAKDGNTGANGVAGKDGVGIKSTVITYQVSDIGTTPPTGTWVATPPAVPAGQFLWTRTVWTYTDGSNEAGYSVAQAGKTGPQGPKGDTGADGLPGKDGVSVKSAVVTYQLGTSGTTKPTSTWSSTVPTLVKGQYLWTKTTWNYSDSTSEDGYQVTYIGKDGNNGSDGIAGKDGTGINSTVIEYAVSSSGVTKPSTGWSATIPSVASGQFMWTRTTWSYTDGTSESGYSVAKMGEKGDKGDRGLQGLQGDTGNQGIQGPKGLDGKSSYTHIAYAPSSTGDGFTQTPTATTTHVGMYVDQTATDSTDPAKYKWTLIKGADGSQGTPGMPGADGRTPYTHWAYSWSADGTDRFMTVYPGNNLLLDSQTQTKEGAWFAKNWGWTKDWGTYLGSNIFRTQYAWSNARYSYKDLLDRGVINTTDDFTYSVYFRVVGEDPAGMSYASSRFYSSATTKSGSVPMQLTSLKENQWARIVVPFKFMDIEYDPTKDYEYSIRVEMVAAPKVAGAHYEFAAPKLERGTIATLYTSPLDDPEGAYPKFIGTYTDYLADDSTDPSKYTWAKIRGEQGQKGDTGKDGAQGTPGKPGTDGKTPYFHQAWADSQDGKTNFSTTISLGKKYLGTYTDYVADDSADPTKYKWTELVGAIEIGGRNLLCNSRGKFQPNRSATDNYAIYSDSTVYMTQGQQYTVHADASSGLVWSGTHDPGVESNNVVLWLVNSKTYGTVNAIISDANTGTGTTFTWNYPSGTYYLCVNTYKTDNSGYVENVKIEKGNKATDWSPAPEDTDKAIDDANNHTDDAINDVNSSVDNIYDVLGNKADADEFKYLQGQAQSLQDSYESFVGNGGKYESDLTSLEDRATQLYMDLGDKLLQLSFVNTWFKAGEEGLSIGSVNSSVKLLISNDQLSFTDGGQTVAYFTAQSFYINKGAVVTSLQVNQHKLSRIDSNHTAFVFIG